MSQKLTIPASFSMVKNGDTTLFVKEGYREIVLSLPSSFESFHPKHKDDTQVKFGRGSCLTVPVTQNSAERLVIRNYRHGGLFGRLFGGVFSNVNRPMNEICINEIALQKGVPSAEVIAVTRRRLWGLFYRASLVSKEITGAVDVVQFLKESPLRVIQKSKKPVISALAKLIRNMHNAGIYHADLHLKNILLKKDSTGGFAAYVIDLDKSVVLDKLDIHLRIKNLSRLDRYLEKLRWLSGKATSHEDDREESWSQKIATISRADRIRFFKEYMLQDTAIDKNWKYCLRRYHTHHTLHKCWWRLFGLSGNFAK